MRSTFPVLLTWGALFASPSDASISVTQGLQNAVVSAAPGGAFTAGLDWLPNGNVALFDGAAVVEVDPATGVVVNTLFAPAGLVFGSFVKTDPTGRFLLFGESANQTITRIPLDGSAATVVATITFNFDCAFSPSGKLYVSAAPGAFGTSQVLLLDPMNGATSVIANLAGPSGPIAFDAAGNLYYAEASAQFPAPAGQQSIYRFGAAAVAAAEGGLDLTFAHGTVFGAGVTSVADLAFDGQGDLIYVDGGSTWELDPGGLPKLLLGSEAGFNSITTLAYRDDPGPGWFEPFQTGGDGTLAAISTDFFSFNDLNVIRPRPTEIGTSPAGPIPDGPFTFFVQDGPPSGSVLLFAAPNLVPSYTLFGNGVPLGFALDPSALVPAGIVALDGNGAVTVPAVNPAPAAGTFHVQGFALDAAVQVRGSSNAATIVLQ